MLTNIPNHYMLLGVLPTAATSEIKSAYRKKALQVHPDKNNESHESTRIFQQLLEAKNILCDAKTRLEYDYTIGVKKPPANFVSIKKAPIPKQESVEEVVKIIRAASVIYSILKGKK